MIKRNTILVPLLLVLFMLPMTGCFYSREIVQTRRDIERQYPDAEFDQVIVMNMGPGMLHTMGWIAGWVPEEEAQMAVDYLSEIKRVKVGVYETHYLPELDDVDLPQLERFRKEGWEVAVKVREDDEMVWVLYKEQRDHIRDMYVMVLSEDELVLVRVEGYLDRLVAKAMEDHQDFISFTDGW